MTDKLWFRNKSYGWGWTPCSKEGWIVTGAYITAIIILASNVTWFFSQKGGIAAYYTTIVLLVGSLIIIAYRTGEKPQWKWGK